MIDRRRAALGNGARRGRAIALRRRRRARRRRVRRQPLDREAGDERSAGSRRERQRAGASLIDTSSCPPGSDTTGVSGNTITIGTSLAAVGHVRAVHRDPLRRAGVHRLHERQRRRHGRRQEVPDQAGRQGRRRTSRRRPSPTCSRCSTTTRCSRCSTSSAPRTTSRSATSSTPQCVPDLYRRQRCDPVGQPPVPVDDRLRAGAVPARGEARSSTI